MCECRNFPNQRQCVRLSALAVTETRSCTKGSVFLINYSLTIHSSLSLSRSHPPPSTPNDFHLFPFIFSAVLSFSPFATRRQRTNDEITCNFLPSVLRRELCCFAGFESGMRHRNNYLFILWISPQISLHLFRSWALRLRIFRSGGFQLRSFNDPEVVFWEMTGSSRHGWGLSTISRLGNWSLMTQLVGCWDADAEHDGDKNSAVNHRIARCVRFWR